MRIDEPAAYSASAKMAMPMANDPLVSAPYLLHTMVRRFRMHSNMPFGHLFRKERATLCLLENLVSVPSSPPRRTVRPPPKVADFVKHSMGDTSE